MTGDGRPPGETSRRAFLRRAGIGAAGAAVGAAAVGVGTVVADHRDDTTYGFTPLPARSEPGFDHVVVLMFENRSRGRSSPSRWTTPRSCTPSPSSTVSPR